MAVTGARPATGPWFLGGLGGRGGLAGVVGLEGRRRPRPRRRPQRARQRMRGAGRFVQHRIQVRGLLVTIAAAAGLALFYLTQSGHVAATGYEIERLHATLAERRAEQQQLILRIGQARSPAEIARRAGDRLHLVQLDPAVITFAHPSTDPTD